MKQASSTTHQPLASAASTVGARFDPAANPIGFLRLVAATLVLVSHAWELGGWGKDPLWHLTDGAATGGSVAVLFFFVLSGFLVTPSLQRSRSVWAYARARALRLLPAFWVSLVVVAGVVGPLVWWHERGSLAGYLSSSPSPVGFVVTNAALKIQQWGIGGLLDDVPHPSAFNGSLWTLFYEAVAYVVLVPLGLVGALGARRWLLLVLTSGLVMALALADLSDVGTTMEQALSVTGIELVAAFLVGALVWVYRDRLPAHLGMVPLGLAVMAVGVAVGGGRAFMVAGFGVAVAGLVCLRVCTGVGRRTDLSYGVYVYAFPVQQLLATWGVHEWGLVSYVAVTLPPVFGLALLSWVFVERPALRYKHGFRVATAH